MPDASGERCLTGPFAPFVVVNPTLRGRVAEAHEARRARFRTWADGSREPSSRATAIAKRAKVA